MTGSRCTAVSSGNITTHKLLEIIVKRDKKAHARDAAQEEAAITHDIKRVADERSLDAKNRAHQAEQTTVARASRLPPFPKLTSVKDLPGFWQIAKSYIADPVFSPGGGGDLTETAANRTATAYLDTAMTGKLCGDARVVFQDTE